MQLVKKKLSIELIFQMNSFHMAPNFKSLNTLLAHKLLHIKENTRRLGTILLVTMGHLCKGLLANFVKGGSFA